MKESKQLAKKLDTLTKAVRSLERRMGQTNRRMDNFSKVFKSFRKTEQLSLRRAKTEQLAEQNDQTLTRGNLIKIRGKHRELLALLMNEGYHTYEQIADKMDISQSRARAYVADLKNSFNVPLTQFRDPEGYKIGIDVAFVEGIIGLK